MAKRPKRQSTNDEIIASFDEKIIDAAERLRADPVLFCRIALGFTPHPKQEQFLRLPLWEQYHVMLPWGRQMGKSFIVAAFIAWAMFAHRDFRVFLFSPAEDQAKAIFDQVVKFYQRSPILRALTSWRETGDEFTVGGAEWGAYCELVKIGHKGRLGRGRSTQGKGLIVFEEYNVLDMPEAVKNALTPIMRSGGGEVLISSPGDPGGAMHRIYRTWKETQDAGNLRYHVIECSIHDITHLPPEYAEDAKREMSDWEYRRELLGEWIAPADQFFDYDDVARCVLPMPVEWAAKDQFIWAYDPGGRGHSAFQVLIGRFKTAPNRIEIIHCLPYYLVNQKYRRDVSDAEEVVKDWARIEDALLDLRAEYPPAWVGVDPNTENSLSSRLALTYHFPIKEIPIGGYSTKERLYLALKNGIREKQLLWTDQRITDQLRSFCPPKKDNGQYDFPSRNTDIVSCCVMLYQYLGLREETPFFVMSGERKDTGDPWAVW